MALRIAIVGCGKVAREEYIPYLAKQPDVALAYHNRTAAPAEEMSRKFGGQILTSLTAVADWGPTAVLLLTAETIREKIGKALIESGVPRIFFEKPLVAARGQAHVTEEDFLNSRDLLALAKSRNCETAMVFNYRFFEQTLAAKNAVESRSLGKVTNFAAQVHFACWSHCIDLIHHFAGDIDELTALSGATLRTSSEIGVEALDVTAALRTAGGATGTLIGTAGMKWQHPLYELIFTFENGRIYLRDLDGPTEILDGHSGLHETTSLVRDTSRWAQYSASFQKSVGAYLDSLRENRPPPVPGIDGLRELQVEAAIRRSIAQRRPVVLGHEFPLEP